MGVHVATLPFALIEMVFAVGQIAARMTIAFAAIPAGKSGVASCAAAAFAPAATKTGIAILSVLGRDRRDAQIDVSSRNREGVSYGDRFGSRQGCAP